MDYQEILTALATMTEEQLTEVRRRSTALLKVGTRSLTVLEQPSPDNEDDDYLLSGIREYLRSVGQGGAIPPPNIIERSRNYKPFIEESRRQRQMLEKQIENMSRVERKALGFMCARALAHRLEKFTAVGLEQMMRHLNLLPEALEAAFPGYLSSKLLRVVLRTRRTEQLQTERD